MAFSDNESGLALRLVLFLVTCSIAAHSAGQSAAELFERGSRQFNSHDFTQARASFEEVIALDKTNAPAYRALGMTELELKDYQAAYSCWLKATQLDPKDEKSRYYLGRLFYEADLANEGAAWLRQALQLAPDDYQALTYMGLCAEALGFDETAVKLYRKAITDSIAQQKPYAEAYLSLGNYLKKHGNEQAATSVLEEGAQRCPEPRELAALGELLAAHGDLVRAEAVLRHATEMDPALSQAHYRLALLLRSLGRTQEAAKEMRAFQAAKAEEDKAPKILALRK